MNLSALIQLVRDRLDDPNGTKYTDAEIVRHIDEQARVMFRKQTQAAKEWHNFGLLIQKESGRQLFGDVWEWRLPMWVDRVTKVFIRQGAGTAETTYSPYLWTGNNGVTFGPEIRKTDITRRDGWTWEGQRTFRLWKNPTEQELIVLCCKVPPPVLKVKIAHAYTDGTGAYLPASSDTANWLLGAETLEEGIYVNQEMMVVSTAGAADTHYGNIRRCVYSQPNAIDGGARYQLLRFDSTFGATLAVGDTIESVVPVADAHATLLVLLCVNSLFVKKNNTDGQKSLAGDLGKEWQDFISFASATRDTSGPYFKVSYSSRTGRTDLDKWQPFGPYVMP